MKNIKSYPAPALELGILSSAIIKKSILSSIDYGDAAWAFDEQICSYNENYGLNTKLNAIAEAIAEPINSNKRINTLICVGYESLLIDALIPKLKQNKKVIILPNSPEDDTERMSQNYTDFNVTFSNPFSAWDYVTPSTMILILFLTLSDQTIWVYRYPRRFLGSDLRTNSFRSYGIELLPELQIENGYSPVELAPFSQIENKYFNSVLKLF